jgi:hypothetical protein
MIKVIVMMKRHPDLSVEAFRQRWREHAQLLLETPSVLRHLLRYEQNLRTDADYARGEVEFDGVMSAWYANRAEMEAVFEEPEYRSKIAPDELTLSDADRNIWLVTEEESVFFDQTD